MQGDQYDAIEAYQRDVPELKREKMKQYMKSNETMLSKFRMQFAWTFVAFAGLRRGKFGMQDPPRKQSRDRELTSF